MGIVFQTAFVQILCFFNSKAGKSVIFVARFVKLGMFCHKIPENQPCQTIAVAKTAKQPRLECKPSITPFKTDFSAKGA